MNGKVWNKDLALVQGRCSLARGGSDWGATGQTEAQGTQRGSPSAERSGQCHCKVTITNLGKVTMIGGKVWKRFGRDVIPIWKENPGSYEASQPHLVSWDADGVNNLCKHYQTYKV